MTNELKTLAAAANITGPAVYVLLKNDASKLLKDMDILAVSAKNDFSPVQNSCVTILYL